MHLLLQLLLRVAEEHEGKMVVAAVDGAVQEETDHATQSCIHNDFGIDAAGRVF